MSVGRAPMSQMGHSRYFRPHPTMSALSPITTKPLTRHDGRKRPKRTHAPRQATGIRSTRRRAASGPLGGYAYSVPFLPLDVETERPVRRIKLADRNFVGRVPDPFAGLAVNGEWRITAPGAVLIFARGAPRLGFLRLRAIGLEIGHDNAPPPTAELRSARRSMSGRRAHLWAQSCPRGFK